MKGLTHNLMHCMKCQKYPLKVAAQEVGQLECEFDNDHIVRMIPKLDWTGLLSLQQDFKEFAKKDMTALPESQPVDLSAQTELLKTIHNLIMEIKVVTGHLECESCGTKFEIKDTIPNMVLNEK